jgi:glyoxylase-like metal-dependent hydrolase (beta-lactamase superfamily II)
MKVETIAVGAFEVNCFVLWDRTDRALVVDPGADAARIERLLARRHLAVAAYLATHGHMDHLSALAELVAARPAPVFLHPADQPWAFTDDNQMPPFYPPPRAPASELLVPSDAELTALANMPCRVLATPGHTPGSVCYLVGDPPSLLSGDTLFSGSVGRTDLPGGNGRLLAASLRTLAGLPDDVDVLPGHGPTTTVGVERSSNPFMQEA